MKNNSYFSKILALLCTVAMVITMMPLGLMSGTETYAVDQTAAEASAAGNSKESAGEEEKKPAQEETKPAQEESKPAQEAGSEKTDPETESGKDNASGKETDNAVAEPKKEEAQADSNADKKAEEKAEDKKAEDKVFKAEFDFGENYAKFSVINPKKTDNDGEIKLPEKPEARKKVYEARDGKKYYFTGWKYKGDEYEPGDKVTLKADAKFTAVWKQIYTIQFSAKGIEADKVEDQIAVYGEPVVLPDETASKDGMDFVGWTPDQGKTVYKAGTEIKAEKIEPAFASTKNSVVKLRGEIEDTTPPVIFVGLVSKTDDKAKLSMYASDNGSGTDGIETLAYVVSDADVNDSGYSDLTGWTVVTNNASFRAEAEVENEKYLIVKAVDTNGNTAYTKRHVNTASINTDVENLKVTISSVTPGGANYSSSHTINFTTSEGDEKLALIQVEVDKKLYCTLEPTATSVELALEDGSHTVQLWAVGEWDSRSGSEVQTLKFDSTAPVVDAQMTETAAYYSKNNCGITVSASEEETGSGIASIEVKTTVDGTEKVLGTASGETAASGNLVLSAAQVSGVLGEIEKELTVSAIATDKAGVSGTKTFTFKYDNVAPKLKRATTANASTSEAYDADSKNYYHGRTTTTVYEVEEGNLKTISLSYKQDGTEMSGIPDISNKKVTGTWNAEGVYKDIKVSAEDQAGNKLELAADFTCSLEDAVDTQASGEGVIVFMYGKVVDTTAPTATVWYDTGTSPVTGQKAKIHLYKGANITEAYVSGNVKVTKVRVEDNWPYLNLLTWQTPEGTMTKIPTGEIHKDASRNVYYAELTNIDLLKTDDADGTKAYQIYGRDLALQSLKVTEKYADGIEVEGHDGAAWPAEPKRAGDSNDTLQLRFTKDTVQPEYTSSFSVVTSVTENVAEDSGSTGEYVGYYGKSAEEKIDAGFEIVDANLDNNRTWAMVVSKTTGDDYSVLTPQEDDNPDRLAFQKETNKYTCSKTVSGTDGVYRFYVYGIDKAGNPLKKSETEAAKDSAEGAAGYNRTISCGSDKPGKYRSFSKVLDTEAPGYGLRISDEDKEAGYLIKYGNLAVEKQDLGTDGTYEPFRKDKTATVLAKGYDKSPVKIQYRFKTSDKNSTAGSWSVEPAEGLDPYSTDGYISSADKKILTKTKEGQTQFRVKGLTVCDRAGNTTSLEESNTVYLDGTEPERGIDIIDPEVSIVSATKAITRHDTGYELYDDSVTLKFNVKDPNKNKSSSGLQDVWYTASVEGEVIAEGDLIGPNEKGEYFKDGYFLDLDKAEVAEAVKAKEAEGKDGDEALEYEIERTVTIPKGKVNGYESNDIVITLHAKDNSDNEADTEKNFGIDSIEPVITVEYDNNDVRNEKYFKAKRTATVVVTDRNLGESSDKIKISTQGKVDSKWTYHKGDDKFGDEDTWTKKIVYDHDGDYTLKVRGTDALGNGPVDAKVLNDKQKAPWAFTVDMTAPVIKVTFDNNSVRNGKYYKANRTATITIVEHNFYDPDVKTPGTAKAPRKKAMKFPGRTKFSSKGDRRRSTIDFNKEGNYTFDVTYTDLAGNPAKTVKIPEFVIDKTPPVVKIENVDANGIYSGAIAPRASFDDDNFDRNNSKFIFTGAKGGDRSDLAGGMKENEYGGVYTMSDFARIRKNDDIYTASATSTDMAGNTTTVTLSFSVNRFGSTYDYDGDTATITLVDKKSGKYYTNKPQPLVLREINVNPLKKYTLTLYKDDTSRKLQKGVDYRVEQRRGKGGYECIYYISEDVITDEGSYNIVATSEDEAGNMNTNASVRNEDGVNEVPLKFVYDTTVPTVSFLDLSEQNQTITLKENGSTLFRGMPSLNLGVRPDDDWALSAIEIGIRSSNSKKGQLFGPKKYEGEEFWERMGEDKQKYFEEIINSGSDTKYIDLTVWDAAGNESKMTYEVIVTANIFELMLHYWYIVLVILLAIAGGVYYYIRRKRNQEEGYAE